MLVFGVLVICVSTTVSAEIVDRIAAVVNRKVITFSQVQQTEQQLASSPTNPSADKSQTREQALSMLIENELIRQKAEEIGVLVNDEELNAAIADIKKMNKFESDDPLKEAIRQEGKTWEEFVDHLRGQIKTAKLINRDVRSQVNITEEELKTYYQSHATQFAPASATAHIRQIILNVKKDAVETDVQAVKDRAAKIVQELRAGADFATAAQQYSEDASASSGGDLGIIKQGQLAASFDMVFTLKEGEISDPVRSDAGFHIFYVQKKIEGEQATFESAKAEIRQKLFEEKSQEIYQKWIAELKENAFIEIQQE